MSKLKNYILNETMKKVPEENEFTTDGEILQYAIQAELDAINLYQYLSRKSKNENVKKVLLDIAKEEKTHIYEFQLLLEKLDKEYPEEKENAQKELDDMDV